MKVHKTSNDVLVSGGQESAQFKIAQTAHTFQVLSEGLYSNKIRAIIRELACNAVDSHKMTGQERPFDVQLPTRAESKFAIRDYGTGLSHEDVMGLYTTYMASTKQESNEQIGCFGLGSKSPFAYTKSFTVRSFFNGEVRTYSAFIGDAGVPECVLLATADTDQPNGLEVSFPTVRKDLHVWAEESREVFRPFEQKPNFNSSLEVCEYKSATFEDELPCGTRFMLHKYRMYNSPRMLVMGNVEYPIHSLPENLTKRAAKFASNFSYTLFVPIGTVAVTPSRESVSWTPQSVANISLVFEELLDWFEEKCSSFVDQATTITEARKALITLQDTGGNKALIDVEWKGRKVNLTVPNNRQHSTLHYVKFNNYNDVWSVIPCGTLTAELVAEAIKEIYVSKWSSATVQKRFTNHNFDVNKEYYVLIPQSSDVAFADVKKDAQALVEDLGYGVTLKDVPACIPKKDENTNDGIFTFSWPRINCGEEPYRMEDAWDEAHDDYEFEEGGVYCLLHGKNPMLNGEVFDVCSSYYNGNSKLRALNTLHKSGILTELTGIRKSHKKRFEESDKWVELTDYLNVEIPKRVANLPSKISFITYDAYFLRRILSLTDNLLAEDKESVSLRQELEENAKAEEDFRFVKALKDCYALRKFVEKIQLKIQEKEINQLYKTIWDAYPMLKIVIGRGRDWNHMSVEEQTICRQYVEMMREKNNE